MAESWTSDRFPQFEEAMRRLVGQHLELKDEPLHLAIAYQPAHRDPQDVFLFEVVGAFGNSLNPEQDLFEVTFASSPGFPMAQDEELHLVLTSPHELDFALSQGWPLADELVSTILDGNYHVLFHDPAGVEILARLRTLAGRLGAVRG